MRDNFTQSEIWKLSNKIRYDILNVEDIGGVHFLNCDSELLCLQYFDVDFNKDILNNLSERLDLFSNIKFKYLNIDEKEFANLKNWCLENDVKIVFNDIWEAPQLFLRGDLSDYIKTKSNNLRRDFLDYKKDNILKYVLSPENSLQLWTDVLKIDKNSWKGQKSCDMKALDREDLQYVFKLLQDPQNSSLLVAYWDNEPVAYSLWFKAGDMWFAAKWGASDKGRLVKAGINTLFKHIEYMLDKQDNILELDFWGRRSRFYDMLKNREVKRSHLEIRRNNGE